ncbi:uncharacterized protein LOC107832015 isoform X1 [Nicotiana tabacum]|uniref:Uncharacterized protein At5g41620 isoform X1 n=3 Tax=Nicotiana TaxID=4085 RepID=A0A1S4DPF0_TOBAC|nr:PREDICTED: uncharacterized protein At5g41620-like [Nicotiana sylvestris]XP_016515302.1 PREDICTED: uncharacterized protein At5g41620-like isoform X1 [Nicotiana tabacum]
MLRQNLYGDGRSGGKCNNKVRKRGGSTSSSSSLIQSYRLKRAILVGKKGGSSTPVPMWKMNNSRSPSLQNDSNSKSFKILQQQTTAAKVIGCEKGKEILSVSARKLGATLWEINGVLTPNKKEEVNFNEVERVVKSSSKFDSVAFQLSHTPASERMERSKVGSHRRRSSIGSQKLVQTDFSLQNDCLLEVDQTQQNYAQTVNRHRLKDVRNGLAASKELLKVLNRVWGLNEHQSTCLSLFSAIKAELDRACIQVTKLIHEQRYNNGEIDVHLKQFEEEKAAWKLKEQDKIHSAITSIAKELKIEKKLRKQTERINKKLGKELADTKTCLSKAVKELEGEKRAREILEQVCDELARGIGEDRAEVEELKRQSAKVREEVEKEREMLQLADVLREERVQMKLSEAKYQFEEKNAVVDKLRNELEAYLRSKKGQEQGGDDSPNYERIKELEKHLRETLPTTCYYQDKEKENGKVVNKEEDDDDDDDSADSDLHSIELNMDDNTKSYEWGSTLENDPKRLSVSDKSKGRKSISEKFPRQSISIEWEFGKENVEQERSNFLENGGIFDFSSQVWKKDCEDEIERYKMIKDLRDHIVSSASRKTPTQGFSGPTKNWSQQNTPSNDADQ